MDSLKRSQRSPEDYRVHFGNCCSKEDKPRGREERGMGRQKRSLSEKVRLNLTLEGWEGTSQKLK